MKKTMLSIVGTMTVVGALLFYSCIKEEQRLSNSNSFSEDEINNVLMDKSISSSLISILNNPKVSDFEKGNALLNEGELPSNVLSKLIDISDDFDSYTLELIYTSQTEISEGNMLRIINSKKINDEMLKNVLITRNKLTEKVKGEIRSKRPTIVIDEVTKMNSLDKMICLCMNRIILAEHITEVEENGDMLYIIENPIYIPFNKQIGDGDLASIAAGCGKRWICGQYSQVTSGNTTIGKCVRPPNNEKCIKRLKSVNSLDVKDEAMLKMLHSSNSTRSKAKQLLEEDDYSQNVLSEFISMKPEFSDFVSEIVLLSANSISDDNLIRLIASKNFSNGTVENALILNSPINARIEKMLENLRPELNILKINNFSKKEIGISLCNSTLMIGDKIEITEVNNNRTDISVHNLEKKPFATPLNSDDLHYLMQGCGGRYTCGDLVIISGDANDKVQKFTCYKPPNTKCYKKAKTVSQ